MASSFAQITVAALVLASLVFLNGFGLLAPVLDTGRLGMSILVKPLEKTLIWIRDFVVAFISVHDLVSQNIYLTEQVAVLNSVLSRYEQIGEENRVLREAIGFQTRSNLELIPAEILSYDYLSLDQSAIINRGLVDGLSVGDTAVAADGILVGTLTEVSNRTSKLELITASGVAVNARTTTGSASGIVSGVHGLGLIFDQISLTEELKADDRIVTSGLGGKFPANLYVGNVSEVNTKPNDLFQSATVLPPVDYRNLRVIFVLKKS